MILSIHYQILHFVDQIDKKKSEKIGIQQILMKPCTIYLLWEITDCNLAFFMDCSLLIQFQENNLGTYCSMIDGMPYYVDLDVHVCNNNVISGTCITTFYGNYFIESIHCINLNFLKT